MVWHRFVLAALRAVEAGVQGDRRSESEGFCEAPLTPA